MHDFRFSLRTLRRTPVFTAAALVTLALGIGANTAIFTLVRAVMLRPLPYGDPGQLVMVWGKDPSSPARDKRRGTTAQLERWQAANRSFETLAGYQVWKYTVTGAGEPARVPSLLVSDGFFRCLKVAPALGRGFTKAETQPGADRVAVLSHDFWLRRFAADRGVLGKSVMLDGEPHVVIGVMPAGFRTVLPHITGEAAEVFVPISRQYSSRYRWSVAILLGRLRPGVAVVQAQAEMDGLARAEPRKWGVNIVPLADEIASGVRRALLVLMGAAGCVLLIACANLANLMLARARARRKEIGLRLVLGAGRAGLIKLVMAESLTLALGGGALGLVLGSWIVRGVVALGGNQIPRSEEARLDLAVFAVALALSIVAGVVSGLIPALQAARPDIQEALKEGGSRSGGLRNARWRGALGVAETALALVLATGAGLLLRSFALLKAVDPGIAVDHLMTAAVSLPEPLYRTEASQSVFAAQLVERLRRLPGVHSADITNSLPFGANFMTSMNFEVPGGPADEPHIFVRAVTSTYPETFGLPLVEGRFLAETDVGRNHALVVNRAAARRYWGGASPLGARVGLGSHERTVVGVVADVRNEGLQKAPSPEVYIPFAELPTNYMGLAVRTLDDPARVAGLIRAEVRALDPHQPVERLRIMARTLDDEVARPRFNLVLLGGFAFLALALAAVGIYGVVSYGVAQRTHEFGVRMALGARRGNVLRMVIVEGMRLAGLGVVLGLAGSLAAAGVLASLLFGISTHDPFTFSAVAGLLAAVALAACWIPARKATRVDPSVALRYE